MISKSFRCCVFIFILVTPDSTKSYGAEIENDTDAYAELCEDIWTMYFMSTKTKTRTENDIMDTCIQVLSSATEEKVHSPSSSFTFEEKGKLLDNILETLNKLTTIEAISITTLILGTEPTTISNTHSAISEVTITSIVLENDTITIQNENSTEFGINETTPQLELETIVNLKDDITLFDNNTTTALQDITKKNTQHENTATTASGMNTSSSTSEIALKSSVVYDYVTVNLETTILTQKNKSTTQDIEITATSPKSELEIKTTPNAVSTRQTATTLYQNYTNCISTTSMLEEKTKKFGDIENNSITDNNATSTVADNVTTSTTEKPASSSVTSHGSTTTKYDTKATSTEHSAESDNNATTLVSIDITTINPFESIDDTTVYNVIEDTGNITNVKQILSQKPTESENHLPEKQAGFDWEILQWSLIALAAVLVLFSFIMMYRCLKKRS